jgi:hypothetical protein
MQTVQANFSAPPATFTVAGQTRRLPRLVGLGLAAVVASASWWAIIAAVRLIAL